MPMIVIAHTIKFDNICALKNHKWAYEYVGHIFIIDLILIEVLRPSDLRSVEHDNQNW